MKFNFKLDNKMLIKIIVGIVALVLIFYIGSWTTNWIFIVAVVVAFIVFIAFNVRKDIKIVESSKQELIAYLNGEEALYLNAASLVNEKKEISGILAITSTRLCFLSKVSKDAKTFVEISFKEIKSMPDSNYLRLDTIQGPYMFRTDDIRIIKKLVDSKLNPMEYL